METTEINKYRDKSMKTYVAITFAVLIAVTAAFMMTLTSSPQM